MEKEKEHSSGTVSGGDAICPFSDCGRIVDGEEIKSQAHRGELGEQLFAVVYKHRVEKRLKSGELGKPGWVRAYRAPKPADNNEAEIAARLFEKLPEWLALDIVPNEEFPDNTNDDRPRQKAYPFESGHSIYCVAQDAVRSWNFCAAHMERAIWLGM